MSAVLRTRGGVDKAPLIEGNGAVRVRVPGDLPEVPPAVLDLRSRRQMRGVLCGFPPDRAKVSERHGLAHFRSALPAAGGVERLHAGVEDKQGVLLWAGVSDAGEAGAGVSGAAAVRALPGSRVLLLDREEQDGVYRGRRAAEGREGAASRAPTCAHSRGCAERAGAAQRHEQISKGRAK